MHPTEEHAFLDTLWRDVDAGRLQSLDHYLERFPGQAEAVAREYVAIVEGTHVSSGTPRVVETNRGDEVRQLDHYHLLARIGSGGQGVVYRARDTRLDRDVAIKVLRPSYADLRAVRDRFGREARLASRVRHDGICVTHHVGSSQLGPYLVMELIEGHSLNHHIANPAETAPGISKPSLAFAVEAMAAAADALHAVHAAGIVHCDVKPRNIMVRPKAHQAVVLDFGMAVDLTDARRFREHEISGGTPAYMSPEQVLSPTRVDHRTDIWSLGASLYHLLAQRLPFEGNSATDVYESILMTEPTSLSDVRGIPAPIAEVVDKAMSHSASRRHSSAALFASELRATLGLTRSAREMATSC